MIKLCLLGALDLRGPDEEKLLSVLSQPKRVTLLAFMAVARPRGFHTRDKLLGLFWPEHDQKRARAALRQALYTLRQSVGDDILRSRGSEEVDLNRERVWCDVIAFEEAVERGQVEGALELYRGHLLDGVFLSDCPEFERWLDSERERLRELAAGAAWTLAHEHLRAGRVVEAERTAQRALGLVGTDESAVRAFVRALAEAGDRGAAVSFFERFADGLARDLDLRPAAESRDLVERIRASMEILVSEDWPGPVPSHHGGSRESVSALESPASDGLKPGEAKEKHPRDPRLQRLKTALASRYAIEEEIGRGGMGTVYRATDLKHQRKVAIKVLQSEAAAVVEADRFFREIETAASLNHPHILPVHDSGRAADILYYVTPYVATESLRARLEKERQLPVDDAVRIASAVASALDYAHREGVIHRDIKPANILLQDGEPLLADFGIAVAADPAPSGRFTGPGFVVGSPEYMSPEQAIAGQVVGPASDIYALGCVLYEMLAGEPPFTGATAQAALAKIRTETPRPLSAFRSMIPPNVDAAIRRALEKAPADRFSSARRFAEALDDPTFCHGPVPSQADGNWKRTALAGWGVVAALVFVGIWSVLSRGPHEPSVIRTIPPFIGPAFAISPDGSLIVYGDGEGPLWRHVLADPEPISIAGTEGAEDLGFSPDGLSIVFEASGSIKMVPSFGGPVATLVSAPPPPLSGLEADLRNIPTHPAWGEDGMVYYAQGSFIYRVPADGGGDPERVTTKKGWLPGFPTPLPEGRGILLTVRSLDHATDRHHDSISVVGPNGGEPEALLEGVFTRYARSGHVLYTTWDGFLLAAPFDLETLEITGPSVTLMGGYPGREAIETQYSGKGAFDLSNTGTLVYQTGGAAPFLSNVCWCEDGRVRPVDSTWVGHFTALSLAPDGSRFAVMETKEAVQEIWVSTLDGLREMVWSSTDAIYGLGWTFDSRAVTYLKMIDPFGDPKPPNPAIPFLKQVDSDELEERLLPQGVEITGELVVWHPDGEWFVYSSGAHGNLEPAGIWASRYATDDPPVLLVESDSSHHNLQPQAFSPNGRYLAYLAQESTRETDTGIDQVWVVSFEDPKGERVKIETRHANRVRWSHDGRTVFFDAGPPTLKGIEVDTDPTFSFGRITDVVRTGADADATEVLPDNRTFLLLCRRWLDQAAGEKRYWLVQNFTEELKREVGG